MTPDLRYLTITEAAELLRVSSKTLARWAKADMSMPVLRIGAVTRFPQERLLTWLRSKEQGLGKPRRSREPLSNAVKPIEDSALRESTVQSCAKPFANACGVAPSGQFTGAS